MMLTGEGPLDKPNGAMLTALRGLPTDQLIRVGAASLRMARLCEETGQDELALCHSATLVLAEWALFERSEMVDLETVAHAARATPESPPRIAHP
jgi:hypothetical protein